MVLVESCVKLNRNISELIGYCVYDDIDLFELDKKTFAINMAETNISANTDAERARRRAAARERRDRIRRKKRMQLLTVVLVIGLALGAAVTLVALTAAGKLDWSRRDAAAETTAEEETGEETEMVSVPLNALLSLFDSFGVGNQMAQSLLGDRVVFRSQDTARYTAETIRSDIDHNTYDWQYLTSSAGRWYYDDGQGTKSILGIDVSQHQGTIDWEAVASDGIKFAVIRVVYRGYGTEGTLHVDERAVENIEGALAAGLDVGVYVFSQATNEQEVLEEAELVLDTISGYDISYPIVFDMEKLIGTDTRIDALSQSECTSLALTFCGRIAEEGYRPMIYGNTSDMLETYDLTQLGDIDLWYAQYFSTPSYPYRFEMMQYTSNGSVEGIDGNVDIDISFVDYASADTEQAD